MYIIECLPIAKINGLETLTYFSGTSFEAGSLVKIPVRGSLKLALVLESRRADQNRAEIRSANFALKKIDSAWSNKFLKKEFLEASQETARYFSVNVGAVISQLLPAVILQNPKLLFPEKKDAGANNLELKNEEVEKDKEKKEVLALQTENEDRFAHYRALVREDFASKKSVFLCLPQNESVEKAREKIERGIEQYVVVLNSNLNKSELGKELRKAMSKKHPVLVVATASWLFLPRDDWGTIVIEEENNKGWQTFVRPFTDLRFFAESLGKKQANRVILGDSVLSINTLWRHKEKSLSEFETVKWRLQSQIKTEVLDLRKAKPEKAQEEKKKEEWRALSPQLLERLKESLDIEGNVFVFASRKGIAPIIICRDCNNRIVCNNCESPMTLHKLHDQNIFKCHQCGEIRDPNELCPICQSWNLVALGAGIDKVADELRKHFPEIEKRGKIFELHGDSASTANKARGIASDFESGRGNILVGTEMAFSYLRKKVHTSAISSLDSLFAIPDFQIRERIFRIITEIKNMTKEIMLVQSRNTEDPTIRLALSGNLADFYRSEIEDRQNLNYPPFSIFIKITVRGTKDFVTKETEKMKSLFENWEPAIFSSVHEKKGKQMAVNAVLKIRQENFPDPHLSRILEVLPPHFEIKVNPENLL